MAFSKRFGSDAEGCTMQVVDTSKVTGRRELRFASFDEMLAEAARLAASPDTKMLGNWPLGELFSHLGSAIDNSIDDTFGRAPWFFRMIGPFLKRRFITKGFSPGFKLPKEIEAKHYPTGRSLQEALDALRQAVGRTRTEQMTGRHPVLGKLTNDEWTQLHLRHAEMHLSFAVPGS
jgi:Protein of unknown function (DUF1569)